MEPEEIFVSVLVVRWCSVQEHLFCTSLFENIKKSITVSMWLEQSLQSSVKMQKGVLAISETWKLLYQGWAL